MGYFEEIFEGKTSFDISEQEQLNETLKQGNWTENQENEAKYFKNFDKPLIRDNITYESHIIKPIVGFLNSLEGGGNLFLGIDTGGAGKSKFLKIKPIDTSFIKNEDHLNGLIDSKIKPWPSEHEKPKIEIKRIKFKSGNVFMVSVYRTDSTNAYYSSITECVYKRHNSNTNKLNLIESMKFLESKSMPRIYIKINRDASLTGKHAFSLSYVNLGTKPGFNILSIIGIVTEDNCTVSLKKNSNISSLEDSPKSKVYQVSAGMPPNTIPIYPDKILSSTLGILEIEENGNQSHVRINTKTYENEGMTEQSFLISIGDEIAVESLKRTFTSYK